VLISGYEAKRLCRLTRCVLSDCLALVKAGQIPGFQAATGTIIVTESPREATPTASPQKTVIYRRVSAAENKHNLEGQARRLRDYCAAKGYPVAAVVQEIGSGVNDPS